MSFQLKKTFDQRPIKLTPLVQALNQSERVQDKVGECAEDLSSINAVLKEGLAAELPLEEVEQALELSEEIEDRVLECADDLRAVNTALAEEIAERKILERRLSDSQVQEQKARYLAYHDAATGLANRTMFRDRIEHALIQAERHQWLLALMVINLEKFNEIRDNFGNEAGDRVLKIVAERLQTSVREEDTVSRQGDDAFLCLLLDVKAEINVANIAKTINETILTACEFHQESIQVQPNIGIALYPSDGKTAEALLYQADVAMCKAKQLGYSHLFFGQIPLD